MEILRFRLKNEEKIYYGAVLQMKELLLKFVEGNID